jgi:hypothetical protein
MATRIDVCNLALGRIGQEAIATLDEASNEARMLNRFWDPDRKSVLRAHPWNFATETSELAEVLDPVPDFDYVYELPADCIRALTLTKDHVESLFEIRGRTLVTDVPGAILKYVKDVTDTAKFDDRFVEALSYRLAMDIALPITGNEKLQQGMIQLYNGTMSMARATDAQEGRRKDMDHNSILDSRK